MELNTNSLSFLLGKRLDQVCFGLYIIHLNFSFSNVQEHVDCSISIFRSATILNNGLEDNWTYKNGKKLFSITSLLNETIRNIEIEECKNIILKFSNSFSLKIYADLDKGESYEIRFKEDFIII